MAESPQEDFDFPEQVSPLLEMAIIMHETYTAFLTAGFSEDQSMQLITGMADVATYEESDEDDRY
jgi:hypothetical protein